WRSWSDLDDGEKRRVVTALVAHMLERGCGAKETERLAGETYTLIREPAGSPTRDAKEFGTLVNACGRYDQPEVGYRVCRGDREDDARSRRSRARPRRGHAGGEQGRRWIRRRPPRGGGSHDPSGDRAEILGDREPHRPRAARSELSLGNHGGRSWKSFYTPRHFDGRFSGNGEPMTHDAPRARGGRRSPQWPNRCTCASRCRRTWSTRPTNRSNSRRRAGRSGKARTRSRSSSSEARSEEHTSELQSRFDLVC